MCFTVNVNLVKEELESIYGRNYIDHEKYRPSYYYHAFSLPQMPVVCSDRIILMRWGLIPGWVRDAMSAKEIRIKTFNARAETADTKPSFAESFRERRCIVPVSGFYEWQHTTSGKLPWYIRSSSDDYLSLGGLWSEWLSDDDGNKVVSFSIVTTAANALMSEIHNSGKRMPLILDSSSVERWLDAETGTDELKSMMVPCSDDSLSAWTIGPMISARNSEKNTPDLIKPYNYDISGTLFD
ncbi:MAG: SOS response-associated peptidase [Bacteroidales bacterium]